jgi:hypothetical protein
MKRSTVVDDNYISVCPERSTMCWLTDTYTYGQICVLQCGFSLVARYNIGVKNRVSVSTAWNELQWTWLQCDSLSFLINVTTQYSYWTHYSEAVPVLLVVAWVVLASSVSSVTTQRSSSAYFIASWSLGVLQINKICNLSAIFVRVQNVQERKAVGKVLVSSQTSQSLSSLSKNLSAHKIYYSPNNTKT